MPIPSPAEVQIRVVGLGYVGLPLALALARHFPVVGFDADPGRIAELKAGRDSTGAVDAAALSASPLSLADDRGGLGGGNLFIIAVPTPVDAANKPDLSAVTSACRALGVHLRPGAVVVLESTVSPGVTEGVCGPVLESASGLVRGKDFFLGYSPERINPGDHEHAVDTITKVVAAETAEASALLAAIYGTMTAGGVFVARDIRTAEAAKVIENAQRDINIAFVNEVAMILAKLNLSSSDVLAAAATKWNFLDFRPGLVGGHCIGVDPYYLAAAAESVGHQPEIVLAGRRINDRMGAFVAESVDRALARLFPGRGGFDVLVLGLTFKENVRDLRNTGVVDVVQGLEARGHRVAVHDPMADPDQARALHGIALLGRLDRASAFDAVVGAVAHDAYRDLTTADLARLVRPGGLIADVKGMWRQDMLPEGLERWQL